MDKNNNTRQLDNKDILLELEKQAEELFPLPVNPCYFIKLRNQFNRERWIKKELDLRSPKIEPG